MLADAYSSSQGFAFRRPSVDSSIAAASSRAFSRPAIARVSEQSLSASAAPRAFASPGRDWALDRWTEKSYECDAISARETCEKPPFGSFLMSSSSPPFSSAWQWTSCGWSR